MSAPPNGRIAQNGWETTVGHVISCPGAVVLRDGHRVKIERFGDTVRIGCHEVSMSAIRRILELAEEYRTQDGHE